MPDVALSICVLRWFHLNPFSSFFLSTGVTGGNGGRKRSRWSKSTPGARGERNQAQQVVRMGSGEGGGLAAPDTTRSTSQLSLGPFLLSACRLSAALLSVVAGD